MLYNNIKYIHGVVADNDSKYNDGDSHRWTSEYVPNNGIFEFVLPDEYSEISIDSRIKVSGLYDQYYNKYDVTLSITGSSGGNQSAAGSPIWTVYEINTANEYEDGVHDKIPGGSIHHHYPFQDPTEFKDFFFFW